MRKLSQFLVAIAMLIASSAPGLAQVTGNYQYATLDNQGFDAVNIGNLNVHFAIPILNKAGRAGFNFTYALTYDSSVWQPVGVSGNQTWEPVTNFGWGTDTAPALGYISYQSHTVTEQCLVNGQLEHYNFTTYAGWTYTDKLGAPHHFTMQPIGAGNPPPGCTAPPIGSSGSALAVDGSGYTINASVTVSSASAWITTALGKTIDPPLQSPSGAGTATDSNGNQITVDASGHFTDTTGKTALTVAGGAPNPLTMTYSDTSGNPQVVTVTYKAYTVQTAFGCSGVGEYGPTSTSLVDTISFPDGSAYHFSYEPTPGAPTNVTGRLASVTLRQNGTIAYTYSGGSNGIECADGSTAGLTRSISADSGSAASTWTYARTPGSGTSETLVTDGLGNQSTYNFVLASNGTSGTAEYYETARSIYQGADSGTPLLSRQTCYNAEAQPCTTTQFALQITQIDTYDNFNGKQERGLTAKYNSYGLQTEEDDYDFGGASQRGSLLQEKAGVYSTSGIADLVQSNTVFDGSHNTEGLTIYRYDETTPVASSGVPQHIAVSGPRGNLTSVLNYTNSTTYYTTTYAYEDTGSVLASVSPSTSAGATTTYSYDPTFVYNTGVQLPTPSSGVALSSSQTYDMSYTGLPEISTDANSQPTTVKSYDSMLRPAEIDYPDGGKTILTYYSANDTGVSQQMNSNTSTADRTLLDGYGRVSRIAINNGQSTNPWYQQDTCYDANGRVSFQSYRYQGNGWATPKVCSGAGDMYTYDALGRLTNITHGDPNHTSIQYVYSGRTSQSTDENGVSKLTLTDGLGRTTAVCEISSTTYEGDAPAPCPNFVDIAGTGFLTTYTYAVGQTTVTQGSQTRVFKTDWLGRPTSVQEPESGTTTYAYNVNATGPQVVRTRPNATTTTQYDALGRVLSISYSDGTPIKEFSYDANAGWGSTQTNLKGRLSVASVFNSSTQVTGSAFSYDNDGRVGDTWECLPSGCGNHSLDKHLHYTYDWAGDVSTAGDGAGYTTTYTYSDDQEVQTITSSLSDPTHPSALVSSVQNGPDGPLSWQLGNGLYGVRSYDSMGRNNGGWVCSGSTQPYCTGGSQTYGYTVGWSGERATGICDTALNRCSSYGYDDLNRLASQTVTSGAADNFTYLYDRYGNRWQQNVTGGSGPAPQFTFNKATNQISGYTYDAAGDLTSDGSHSYTYDAEGNVTQVDGGATKYTYNAFNQRVRSDQTGSDSQEFVFNLNGQRVSIWDPQAGWEDQGQNYWGSTPVEFYQDGYAQFQHQDYLGTERMRTSYNGAVDGTFMSLPFGDGYSSSGNDHDAYHFAMLDHDGSSDTDHAQFRQYANTSGRWMSPDPYAGSYDSSDPQSFNRYDYVENNPLALVDPTGQDPCIEPGSLTEPGGIEGQDYGGYGGYTDCYDQLGGPDFPGMDSPAALAALARSLALAEALAVIQGTQNNPWNDQFNVPYPGLFNSVMDALDLPSGGCDFGPCTGGAMGFGAGPNNVASTSEQTACTGEALLAGVADFVGVPKGVIDPTTTPRMFVIGMVADTSREMEEGGGVQALSYALSRFAASPEGEMFIARAVGDGIPVLGEIALTIQAGHAAYEAYNAYKECVGIDD